MAARSLREMFSEVYADLYHKCDIVCSTPACFFWAGENVIQYGVPAVVQKSPVRVYVGLERSSSKRLEYSTCKAYDPKKNTFVDIDVEPSATRAIAWLDDALRHEQYDVTSGSRIHFVVEHMLGSGNAHTATTLGAAMSAIAAAIISKYTDITASVLLAGCLGGSGPAFERLFGLASRLAATVTGNVNPPGNGADVFCALVPSAFPQLFVPGRSFRIPGNHSRTECCEKAKEVPYYAVSVSDITGPAPEGAWPFDFGLLYCGLPKMSDEAIRFSQHWKSFWESSLHDIMWLWGKSLSVYTDSGQRPSRVSVADVARRADELWEEYLDLGTMFSFQLFVTLVNLFKELPWSEEIQQFATSVNELALYGRSLGSWTPWMDYLRYRMIYMMFQRLGVTVGMKPAGPGSGGGILFIAPRGVLRDELYRLVEEIRAQIDRDVFVEYASWIHGYEEDGLRVEQNIEENIIAQNVAMGYIGVMLWKGYGRPEAMVLPEVELGTLVRQYEVVADVRNHAVYVAGEQMKTQHGLRSAKYTSELLRRLLASSTLEIGPDRMPPGSYALERSELQGKIVSPLVHVVRQRTGKALKLSLATTSGMVSLQLRPCDVSLCVVT